MRVKFIEIHNEKVAMISVFVFSISLKVTIKTRKKLEYLFTNFLKTVEPNLIMVANKYGYFIISVHSES